MQHDGCGFTRAGRAYLYEDARRYLLEHEPARERDALPEELAHAEFLERRHHGEVVVVDAVDLPVPIAHPEDEIARLLASGVLENLLG